jgi:hypothetical protein
MTSMTYITKVNDERIDKHVKCLETEEAYQDFLNGLKPHLQENLHGKVYYIEWIGPNGARRYVFINRGLEKNIGIDVKAEPTPQELRVLLADG